MRNTLIGVVIMNARRTSSGLSAPSAQFAVNCCDQMVNQPGKFKMRVAFAICLSALSLGLSAQTTPALPASPSSVTNLAAVAVSGVQPGPGLWKVSKGGHTMLLLGIISPLPQLMQWRSADVETAISGSQQMLQLPDVKLKVDVGFFGKLFLLPSAYSARKNDNGATLQQVLPAPMYARWETLKLKYVGKDNGIERWKPIFASQELYKKALKANQLSKSGGVQSNIDALAKKYNVPETSTDYPLVIEHPHDAIKAFKASGLDDVACFGRTLDAVEQDMPAMTLRANAWATGDLEALRKLPDSDRRGTCITAVTDADFARKLGLSDVPARMEDSWLATARASLAKNVQTFAMLPIKELLSTDGYLSKLKAEGYQVEAPGADDNDDAGPASSSTSAPAAAASAGH